MSDLNRRHLLALAGATATATLMPGIASAIGVDYTPGLVDAELAAGKTVFVDFAADWCSTCAAQERVITALLAENPAYEANMSFIRVDWDDYSKAELTERLMIPRRSTLVVLKGDEELGRIVAGTGKAQIKALMDLGLVAATA